MRDRSVGSGSGAGGGRGGVFFEGSEDGTIRARKSARRGTEPFDPSPRDRAPGSSSTSARRRGRGGGSPGGAHLIAEEVSSLAEPRGTQVPRVVPHALRPDHRLRLAERGQIHLDVLAKQLRDVVSHDADEEHRDGDGDQHPVSNRAVEANARVPHGERIARAGPQTWRARECLGGNLATRRIARPSRGTDDRPRRAGAAPGARVIFTV